MNINSSQSNIRPTYIGGEIVDSSGSVFSRPVLGNVLSYEVRMLNLTGRTLYTADSSGIVATVKCCTDVPNNGTIVLQHTRRANGGNLQCLPGHEDVNVDILRRRLAENDTRITWDEVVPITSITIARGGAYIRSASIVVFTNMADALNRGHPLNNQAANNALLQENPDGFDPSKMIGINLMLVDSEGATGTRYVIVQDRVAAITAVQHPSLPSGLHVSGLPTLLNPTGNAHREVTHYTKDEYEKDDCPFRLYSTLVQANDALDKKLAKTIDHVIEQTDAKQKHEAELAILARDNEILKMRNALEKQRDVALEREREMNISSQKANDEVLKRLVAMETERREDERQRRLAQEKEHLESRKLEQDRILHSRNTMVESVKTVGIVVTAGLALWKIFA